MSRFDDISGRFDDIIRRFVQAEGGVFTELCLTYYFLFGMIYTCLFGSLLLYGKGGVGMEPLVYPCGTKENFLLLRVFIHFVCAS